MHPKIASIHRCHHLRLRRHTRHTRHRKPSRAKTRIGGEAERGVEWIRREVIVGSVSVHVPASVSIACVAAGRGHIVAIVIAVHVASATRC